MANKLEIITTRMLERKDEMISLKNQIAQLQEEDEVDILEAKYLIEKGMKTPKVYQYDTIIYKSKEKDRAAWQKEFKAYVEKKKDDWDKVQDNIKKELKENTKLLLNVVAKDSEEKNPPILLSRSIKIKKVVKKKK